MRDPWASTQIKFFDIYKKAEGDKVQMHEIILLFMSKFMAKEIKRASTIL